MKRTFTAIIIVILIGVIGFSIQQFLPQGAFASTGNIETDRVMYGDIDITIEATGYIRANQSTNLTWKTTGTVSDIYASVGDHVDAGQTLASLDQSSLPNAILLAQIDYLDAQRALDDLLSSASARAQAWKQVEQAKQALEDAQNPQVTQAKALQAIANAQKAVDDAQQIYTSLVKPVPPSAIDQAYANMLLAEKARDKTRDLVERIDRRLHRNPKDYLPFERRSLYAKLLRNLNLKLASDQLAYERAVDKYRQLLEPKDPFDITLAEANLAKATAELTQAKKEWQRLKDGTSPGNMAVLEAQLADAQRTWQRLKDGPDTADVAAAEARVAAAKAALTLSAVNAPIAGVITEAPVLPGDQVTPGLLAFRIDDLSHIIAQVQVTEIDINRIRIGQPAKITLDATPGRQYEGRVIEVAAVGDTTSNIVTFDVKIELTNADAHVRPGMSCSATIIVNRLTDVLLVPTQGVRFRDGERLVYIKRGKQIEMVPVTLGESSNQFAQLLTGDLKAGDLVILNPTSEMADQGSIKN